MTAPRILITGATDGIGRALVDALCSRGVRLIAHGRTEAKLQALKAALPSLETAQADFARLGEVRAMAEDLRATGVPLDGLICNAGAFLPERVITEDGFETTFQVNHLAHLRLILDLLPLLRDGARITVLASTSHEKVTAVDLDNLEWQRGYAGYPAYGLAKLAQVGAVMALAPRLAARAITLQALHPGSILTKLQVAGWGGGGDPVPDRAVERVLALALGAVQPSGQWWVDGHPRAPNPLLRDDPFRAALFAASLDRIGLEAPCAR